MSVPTIFNEYEINEKILEWHTKKCEARRQGLRDDVLTYSVYIDAFQKVRRMHGLEPLKTS